MKFLLDMGISPETGAFLREEGAIVSVTEGLIRIRTLPIQPR